MSAVVPGQSSDPDESEPSPDVHSEAVSAHSVCNGDDEPNKKQKLLPEMMKPDSSENMDTDGSPHLLKQDTELVANTKNAFLLAQSTVQIEVKATEKTSDFGFHKPRKSTSGGSSMQQHHRVNFENRSYKCKHCFKVFSKKHNLKEHLNTHSDLRPHKCPECDSSFTEITIMKNHMKKRHGTALAKPVCTVTPSVSATAVKPAISHSVESIMAKKGPEERQRPPIDLSLVEVPGSFEKGEEPSSSATQDTQCDQTVALPYKCSKCHRAFSKNHQLKFHLVRICEEEAPQTCTAGPSSSVAKAATSAEAKFDPSIALMTFFEDEEPSSSKHGIPSERVAELPYKCGKCDQGFSKHHHLKSHISSKSCEKTGGPTPATSGFTLSGTATSVIDDPMGNPISMAVEEARGLGQGSP